VAPVLEDDPEAPVGPVKPVPEAPVGPVKPIPEAPVGPLGPVKPIPEAPVGPVGPGIMQIFLQCFFFLHFEQKCLL
jgi:hypothetical protein